MSEQNCPLLKKSLRERQNFTLKMSKLVEELDEEIEHMRQELDSLVEIRHKILITKWGE